MSYRASLGTQYLNGLAAVVSALRGTFLTVRVLAVLAACVIAAPALAVPVAFHFQGQIVSVDPALAGGGSPFSVGAAVSGTVVYETTAANAFPMPGFAFYPNAVTSLSLMIGGYGASATDGQISISDNLFGNDEFIVVSDRVIFDLTGAAVAGFLLDTLEIVLREMAGDPIAGTALPVVPPDVSLFSTAQGVLGFDAGGGPKRVVFELFAMPVAEPASILIFGAGALFAAWYAARRRTAPTD